MNERDMNVLSHESITIIKGCVKPLLRGYFCLLSLGSNPKAQGYFYSVSRG